MSGGDEGLALGQQSIQRRVVTVVDALHPAVIFTVLIMADFIAMLTWQATASFIAPARAIKKGNLRAEP
jgi:hypothetical protein